MAPDDHAALNHPDVQRWQEPATQVALESRLQAKIATLIEEAPRLAGAAREYWEPTASRPGLEAAGFLPEDLPEQIESLARALGAVHGALEEELFSNPQKRQLWERGRFVMAELRSVLLYVSDVLELDTVPQGLEVEETHLVDHQDLARILSALAETARSYEDTVRQVSLFDGKLVDEAASLAQQLGSLEASGAAARPAVARLNEMRARLALLLQARMRLVYSAARFVFRGHPTVLQPLLGDTLHLEPGADFRIQQVTRKRAERHGPTHLPYV